MNYNCAYVSLILFGCDHLVYNLTCYQSNFLLMEDILYVDSTDHNAYVDAVTPEIKDAMVGVSEAMPMDFNEEQVRTIRGIMHKGHTYSH